MSAAKNIRFAVALCANNIARVGHKCTIQPWFTVNRLFSLSESHNLKELKQTTSESENMTVVEGVYLKSDHISEALQIPSEKAFCPLCPEKLNIEVKYTDVLILSQFMRSDGCLLPRRLTGLCPKAQNKLGKLVHKAQRAGLMPELRPDLTSGKERDMIKSPWKWKKYNTYFRED